MVINRSLCVQQLSISFVFSPPLHSDTDYITDDVVQWYRYPSLVLPIWFYASTLPSVMDLEESIMLYDVAYNYIYFYLQVFT